MKAIQSDDDDDSGTESGSGAEDSEEHDESTSGDEDDDDLDPQINSYGKQALACMFGVKHMPTMCATYPMAREISWADFWHVNDDEATSADTVVGAVNAASGSTEIQIYTSRKERKEAQQLAQNKYVVVHAAGCEGFYPDGQSRTHAFPTESGQQDVAKEQTVEEFLTGDSNIAGRWNHNDWFLGLMQAVLKRGLDARLMSNFTLKRKFIEQLGKIWYNFDATSAGRSRPFKSFARVKKSIEGLTWIVVDATEKFLDKIDADNQKESQVSIVSAEGENSESASSENIKEQDQVERYAELIVRLNI